MSKLIQSLNHLIPGSTPIHSQPNLSITPLVIRGKAPNSVHSRKEKIEEWNKDDIKQWFEENGIVIELYHLYEFNDGSELLSYARILLHNEQSHYKDYSEEFEKRYKKKLLPHQFNKFTNSLQKLPKQPKSSICILL